MNSAKLAAVIGTRIEQSLGKGRARFKERETSLKKGTYVHGGYRHNPRPKKKH